MGEKRDDSGQGVRQNAQATRDSSSTRRRAAPVIDGRAIGKLSSRLPVMVALALVADSGVE